MKLMEEVFSGIIWHHLGQIFLRPWIAVWFKMRLTEVNWSYGSLCWKSHTHIFTGFEVVGGRFKLQSR